MTPRRSPRAHLASCFPSLWLFLSSRPLSLDPLISHVRSSSCHATTSIVLIPSALIDIPPVKIPTPTRHTPRPRVPSRPLKSAKRAQFPPRLAPVNGVCLCARPVLSSSYCSLFLAFVLYYFRSWLSSIVGLVGSRLLSCARSCYSPLSLVSQSLPSVLSMPPSSVPVSS